MEELSRKALRAFSGVPSVDLASPTTALLLIDMQVSCVGDQGYNIRRLRERGLDAAITQYKRQLVTIIPNLVRILKRYRAAGRTIFHTHIVTVGNRGAGDPRQGRSSPEGSDEAAIIAELLPQTGEFVLPKACSGVFTGTNLDYLLRKLGVRSLVIGGVVTNGCVERAITEGYDLGYAPVLLKDASAALTDELHEDAVERLRDRRAHVVTTTEAVDGSHLPATLAPTTLRA